MAIVFIRLCRDGVRQFEALLKLWRARFFNISSDNSLSWSKSDVLDPADVPVHGWQQVVLARKEEAKIPPGDARAS
ncbi:hypothetical protein [Rhizobium leguminosarum]|uniref:Uncharacterized protein n=1 Tax=Rhizobium leguminosarum TaxID=384 RepID=A0A7M3DUN6_RHILE|nr:hypothetical protein [Rhizobium leguminosarum]MDV4164177.1 hypothetical protein [Rhizobium leguminosarum]MDV4174059.1 hypothetical protein [Rhizobium leguminosarum]NKK40479.1 hypothetical protein [Rhizobium leguminosarum bv. viciae]TAY52367.1 hypothetical protein ELH90_12280 [Rhizobium leguminosarum]